MPLWGITKIMNKEIKKKAVRRLKILEGQIRGIQKMVENEEYCIKILHQSSSVKQAISGIEDLILENHLATHVVEQIQAGKKEIPAKEILEIYKLSKRK